MPAFVCVCVVCVCHVCISVCVCHVCVSVCGSRVCVCVMSVSLCVCVESGHWLLSGPGSYGVGAIYKVSVCVAARHGHLRPPLNNPGALARAVLSHGSPRFNLFPGSVVVG